MSLKPKTRRKSGSGKPWGPRTRRAKQHFTNDGFRRYCTNRPKGKDELTGHWSEVDCDACLIKKENKPRVNSEMQEKIREYLERKESGREDYRDT